MRLKIFYSVLFLLVSTVVSAMAPVKVRQERNNFARAIQAQRWDVAQNIINQLSEQGQKALADQLQIILSDARGDQSREQARIAQQQEQAKREAAEQQRALAQAQTQKAQAERAAQEAARKRAEDARVQAEKLAAEEKRLRDEAQKAAAEGRFYHDTLINQVEMRDAEIKNLTNQLNKNAAQQDTLRNQLTDYERNRQRDQERIKKLEDQAASIASKANQELRAQLAEANKANKALEDQLNQIEAKAKQELNEALKRAEQLYIAQLQEEQKKAQENHRALRKEIDDLRKAQASPAAGGQFPLTQKQLDDARQKLQKAQEREATVIAQKDKELAEERNAKIAAEARQAQLQKELNNALKTIEDARARDKGAADIRGDLDKTIKGLQDQIRQLKKELAQSAEEYLEQTEALGKLVEQNEAQGKRIDDEIIYLENIIKVVQEMPGAPAGDILPTLGLAVKKLRE